MEIKRSLCTISFLLAMVGCSYGQATDNEKTSVYVYFDEYDDGEVAMYKLVDKNIKEPDIYIFDLNGSRLSFNTVSKEDYKIVDSCFLKKRAVKSPDWGVEVENYGLNLDAKSTKYEHIYFADKVGDNQFKIVEVVPYIGSIFFAPGGPKRKTNRDLMTDRK
ncbi:hypothetical protein ACFOET_04875 [Parapedobacter deserti]|uniref:Lipoprotein n=1 Tax=Parapedobacter deserti TaxID=1912957 RepID=A0ABV7JIL9_9SPHI